MNTKDVEVMVFDGGRIYQVSPTRFRVEYGDSWREMDISQWIEWLRHDRVSVDRKRFAAMAMQGALGGTPGSHLGFEQLARESVMHADALLKELAK